MCRIEVYPSGDTVYVDESNQEGIDDAWIIGISYDEVIALKDGELISYDIDELTFNKLWYNLQNPKQHHPRSNTAHYLKNS